MKFREEFEKINGEIIRKYYIDDKLVDERTYLTLSDELYDNLKSPKEEQKHKEDEICTCDECQYYLDLINEIRESDDRTALILLQDEVEFRIQEAFKQGQCVVFNELGSYLLKQAAKVENEIEHMYEDEED